MLIFVDLAIFWLLIGSKLCTILCEILHFFKRLDLLNLLRGDHNGWFHRIFLVAFMGEFTENSEICWLWVSFGNLGIQYSVVFASYSVFCHEFNLFLLIAFWPQCDSISSVICWYSNGFLCLQAAYSDHFVKTIELAAKTEHFIKHCLFSGKIMGKIPLNHTDHIHAIRLSI